MGGDLEGDRLHEADQPPLGGGVVRQVRHAGAAGTRRDGHQAAVAPLDHVGHDGAERVEHAGQVDGEHVVPLRLGQRRHRAEAADAGVGDDDVELPELAQRLLDHAAPWRRGRARRPRRPPPAGPASRRVARSRRDRVRRPARTAPDAMSVHRSVTTTSAPAAANVRACDRPWPRPAPVMRATRRSSSSTIGSSRCVPRGAGRPFARRATITRDPRCARHETPQVGRAAPHEIRSTESTCQREERGSREFVSCKPIVATRHRR